MNRTWHEAHVMPKNASDEQRMIWHRAHQKACACRPIPARLLGKMQGTPAKQSPHKPQARPARAR